MSPRKEIENKRCENGSDFLWFPSLEVEQNIENFHICMLFFLVPSHEYKSSYMKCSSNLVYSQI
jgi:hypothetical protein